MVWNNGEEALVSSFVIGTFLPSGCGLGEFPHL